MTYKEISQMIAEVGVPYAYYQFPEGTGQEPPFICFYYPNNNDFVADGENYVKVVQLVIELYTDNKDFSLEATLEAVLAEHDLVFTREETYIDSERMYLETYYTEVIINADSE